VDFIEQWFGISPDGGDGSTEALIIIAAVAIGAAVIAGWALKRMGWFSPKSAR
jgi:hypothetical protein